MKQSLGGMRRRVRTMVFAKNAVTSCGSSSRAGRRLRPNPRQTHFVILSGADRRTQRAQRPLADYAEQGGERQTKCSQESMTNNKESDSSSIFRSPQNDNAAFALNHFRSGTHSSARPGRLRGSHLRCEPAPGARSETLKHSFIYCSQTPRQTEISNWRQRGKIERKDVRGDSDL